MTLRSLKARYKRLKRIVKNVGRNEGTPALEKEIEILRKTICEKDIRQ